MNKAKAIADHLLENDDVDINDFMRDQGVVPKSDNRRVIRYAVTHINRDGMRTLTRANQGRNHFVNKEQAEQWIQTVYGNTPEATIRQVYGPQALGTFEVRPVECYSHGDAIGIFFKESSHDLEKEWDRLDSTGQYNQQRTITQKLRQMQPKPKPVNKIVPSAKGKDLFANMREVVNKSV
jgi:hypothetical protein